MRFRKLAAIAVSALALTALAACNTKVGAAAVVDGHRISDGDVNDYLTKTSAPFQVQAQSGASETIVPRSYVLQTLILGQLFTRALADTKGGTPTEAELKAADETLAQGATPAQQQAQYTKYGFRRSFAALDVRNSTLETILAQRVGATSDAGPIFAEITKLKIPITVSGRYGSWDRSTLSLATGAGDGVPSFITIAPAPADASIAPTS